MLDMEIEYKGFVAKISFSADTDSFFGEVENSSDVMVFHINNPGHALEALQETVDHYLAYTDPKKISLETLLET